MAEIPVCERLTADHGNMFEDTDDEFIYRRVRDPKVIDLLEQIAEELDITPGETHFNSAPDVTTPGITQTLITETVPASTIRQLTAVEIVCRHEGSGWIYVDGNLIGSVRTGQAGQRPRYEWAPRYPVAAGLEIRVDFRARTGSPIVDVECHIQALDKSTP